MSKLSDRIRRASRTEPAPFGFAAAARRTTSPSLLTVVRLSSGELGKAGDAAKAGADAVIVAGDLARLKDTGDAVIGVAAEKADRKAAADVRDGGADFVVLTLESPSEGMLDEKLGFVLEVRGEVDDTRLRLLGDLTLDAIIVPAPQTPVTVSRLLDLRRVSALARAPLLVEVDAGAEASLLQLLRDSGVAGVVVGASAIGKLGELRERILSLPARGRRREEHAEALVPAQATAGHDHDDDYDDD
jgi:hypothetical protein